MNCGCEIMPEDYIVGGVEAHIIFCPMHAAAEQMRDALALATKQFINEAPMEYHLVHLPGHPCWMCAVVNALAAARPPVAGAEAELEAEKQRQVRLAIQAKGGGTNFKREDSDFDAMGL